MKTAIFLLGLLLLGSVRCGAAPPPPLLFGAAASPLRCAGLGTRFSGP